MLGSSVCRNIETLLPEGADCGTGQARGQATHKSLVGIPEKYRTREYHVNPGASVNQYVTAKMTKISFALWS